MKILYILFPNHLTGFEKAVLWFAYGIILFCFGIVVLGQFV